MNLVPLTVKGSPMVKKGKYVVVESLQDPTEDPRPWEYQKDGRKKQISNFEKATGRTAWLNDYKQDE
tara:strand:- start:1344 stop:1544 length:201 start_codon:yes stop_codon:yes gene_type:complete